MTPHLTKSSRRPAACLATAALAALLVVPAFSLNPQPLPPGRARTQMKTATASGKVYVCKQCKAYYSAAAAKKMGYKDPMGHKLVAMSKAPAGYMNGAKMGNKM
ncbi:MAG: hypothetical protein JO250_13510 [Armatimonadetes bacterium]|nr:hypothetical protein [Armatimonadota bacterium]